MAFADLLIPGCDVLQRIGDLYEQFRRISIMFRGPSFECRELGSPSGNRRTASPIRLVSIGLDTVVSFVFPSLETLESGLEYLRRLGYWTASPSSRNTSSLRRSILRCILSQSPLVLDKTAGSHPAREFHSTPSKTSAFNHIGSRRTTSGANSPKH